MRSAERGALEQRLAVNDAAVARFSPKSVRASSCLCMRFLAHPLIFLACLGSPLNSGFPDPNPPIQSRCRATLFDSNFPGYKFQVVQMAVGQPETHTPTLTHTDSPPKR